MCFQFVTFAYILVTFKHIHNVSTVLKFTNWKWSEQGI